MTILPHNIVNDTKWTTSVIVDSLWYCFPTKNIRVDLRRMASGRYLAHACAWQFTFDADSLPAAKAEALRLVREAILAEAEVWK